MTMPTVTTSVSSAGSGENNNRKSDHTTPTPSTTNSAGIDTVPPLHPFPPRNNNNHKDSRETVMRRSHSNMSDDFVSARRILTSKPTGVNLGGARTRYDREMVVKANIRGVIFHWTKRYKAFWYLTELSAAITCFFVPIMMGFQREPGPFRGPASYIDFYLMIVFFVDILVKFHLTYHQDGVLVFEKAKIARRYLSCYFWIDLLGVIPFDTIALTAAGVAGQESRKALLLSMLGLVQYVRLYRIPKLGYVLQQNAHLNLITYTILRNMLVALAVTNFSACIMYYIARVDGFSEDNSWIGPAIAGTTGFDRYVTSLYWSVTTFATVGYGDFSPVSTNEMIWGTIIMFINIVVNAWIIGSITLLVVKGDEKTGEYRDALATLDQYANMHEFDDRFRDTLKKQLRLEFNNREIADEQVLKNFPNALRCRVLRKLYLPFLKKTRLMKGVRQHFVDAFLSSCTVEIFTPGEDIVERGSIMSDLFLLVGGMAHVTTRLGDRPPAPGQIDDDPSHRSVSSDPELSPQQQQHTYSGMTMNSSASLSPSGLPQLEAGDFVGEIGFFTESPQVDSVRCVTVCKTLTLSKEAYRLIAHDHPGSVGRILKNLLEQVQSMEVSLPKPLSVLRAGSMYDMDPSLYGSVDDNSNHNNNSNNNDTNQNPTDSQQQESKQQVPLTEEAIRHNRELTAIQDLVKMHVSKQKDDQTTRFLFAASRGDVDAIALVCDQGFDVNACDYDRRTALMVAAMKGSNEAVKRLLEYNANPNLVDVHGNSALFEAVKNGHEPTMNLLIDHGAHLCMPENLAASVLCQTVFDGDIKYLRRLCRAGIQVDATDYDKRTAAHVAAAEGNTAALKVLVEFGSAMATVDRWGNTVDAEADQSQSHRMVDFLRSHRQSFKIDVDAFTIDDDVDE